MTHTDKDRETHDPRDAPWFPLWVADWLSGQGPSSMTAEQEGAYLRLLLHSWLEQPRAILPDDDVALAKLSRLGRRWKTVGALVRAQFHAIDGKRLANRKLTVIAEGLEQRTNKARE